MVMMGGFLQVLRHDITEILLEVTLNILKPLSH